MSLVPRGEVLRLLLGELVDLDAHRLELQPRDLLVDLLRHDVDLPLEVAGVLHRVLGRERLVRERHVHHERGMALGGGEVDEPAVGDEVEPPPVGERELLDELARLARLRRERLQRRDVDLDVEVAGVGEDRAVLHPLQVLARDDVLVAGRRAEDVADLRGLRHRQHLEAVHHGLERAQRIDLGDDHVRAHAARAGRDAATDPAVAGDDEALAGEQDVRRADDAVDRRLARAVAVVEQVLRVRLVDGDDREAERAVRLERLEPDDAGRRLLGAGDDVAELLAPVRVQDADHVGAVVHRQVRLVVDGRLDVRVVRVVVLALDREDADVELVDERRGDVVLGRERVRRAEHDVRAARLQRAHQVRRLRRHVQARRDAVAVQRLLRLESLPDRREHRHLPVRPLDPPHALGREREVFHVVPLRRCHRFLSLLQQKSQAASSRSCFRCSHSSASSLPANHVSTAARSAGLAPEARGEGDVGDLDAKAPPELRERAQLVQLAQSVEPVPGAAPARDDEPSPLEVAQHPRRPAGPAGRLADGDRLHAANLNTSVSRLRIVPSRP